MENKTFLFDYEAIIDVAGTVQVKAESIEKAKQMARQLIIKNLEVEDTSIELGLENNNNDDVTIREMGNPQKINMSDGMPMD